MKAYTINVDRIGDNNRMTGFKIDCPELGYKRERIAFNEQEMHELSTYFNNAFKDLIILMKSGHQNFNVGHPDQMSFALPKLRSVEML